MKIIYFYASLTILAVVQPSLKNLGEILRFQANIIKNAHLL